MTFDKAKKEFMEFLELSNVNLGRKTTKTRKVFFVEVEQKLEALRELAKAEKTTKEIAQKKVKKTPMSGSVKCIKPKDSKRGLSLGKGVHAMTSSESARADEQLGHSPYASGQGE